MPLPLDGNSTTEVSSRDSVELPSITVSSLLVMELITELTTGLSRTPGELDGESLVTSESSDKWTKRELVSAVFNNPLLIQSTDRIN